MDNATTPLAKRARIECAPDPVQSKRSLVECALKMQSITLANQIRQSFLDRGTSTNELKHIRSLLFLKMKYPVGKDLWLHSASQPGEEQHVNAVVSETFVLQQLQQTLQLRERWLRDNNLPLDFQMRNNIERPEFNKWAKDLWEQTFFQRQKRLWDDAYGKNVSKRNKSRWNRELQRRMGSHQVWYMVRVCFYGSRTHTPPTACSMTRR